MQMLDSTVLNTALPLIAADLHQSPLNMQSAVVSYALTLAMLMPASAYLSERFGTRQVFSAAMLVFVAGSLLCALAPSLPKLHRRKISWASSWNGWMQANASKTRAPLSPLKRVPPNKSFTQPPLLLETSTPKTHFNTARRRIPCARAIPSKPNSPRNI